MDNFKDKSCAVCGSNNNVLIDQVTDFRIKMTIKAVVCQGCGLVFLNPGPTESAYLAFYRNQMGGIAAAPSLKKVIKDKEYQGSILSDFMCRNIPSLSTLKAIDVGSGWGGFLHYLKPLVKELASIEVMAGAKKFIQDNFNVSFAECARILECYPEKSFDLITSIAVIEHYPDPISALNDYYYALKDGGYLLIYTHDVRALCVGEGVNSYFKFVHPYYYSANTLRALLAKIGFGDFRYWVSKPSLPLWSVRYPDAYAPGDIILIARKVDRFESKNTILYDDYRLMLKYYSEAILIKKYLLKARELWLGNFSIPIRLLSKLVPHIKQNNYEFLAKQYWANFDEGRKHISDYSFSHQFEQSLSRLYYSIAVKMI